MDVTIVLDFSGSIEIVDEVIFPFAESLIYGLPIGQDRANVAMITYTDDATLKFNLDTYDTKRELLTALAFANVGGKTNTAAALRLADREVFNGRDGDRRRVGNKVILVTDGRSNIRARDTMSEAQNLKDNDVDIFVVAVNDDPDMGEVNGIASNPQSEFVHRLTQARDVEDVTNELLDILCER